MSNVTPLPRQPRAPQSRPLTFRGAYGQPGGDGLDSLARLLLTLAAEEDPQPHPPPEAFFYSISVLITNAVSAFLLNASTVLIV